MMDQEGQSRSLLAPTVEYLSSVKVFPLIPHLKRDVTRTIDSALSWEQLTASDINFSIVRPLVQKYARLENLSVVYACLVVRSYFLGASEDDLAYSSVMLTRANLCEIMAMKLLNGFAGNHIQLVAALTTSWNPLAGAMPDIIDDVSQALGDEDVMNSPQSALEMAIATQAKHLLSTPVAQRVVNDIYSGRVVFSTVANRSVLADNYKPRPIEVYDTRTSPFLDHYRLRVPRYGAILEFMNFSVLLVTFVLCLFHQDPNKMNAWEATFILFASSFALQEWTASTEHGWIIYIANMWNVFDTSFILVFISYLGFRIHGLAHNNVEDSMTAFDLLACGACILFPRLAFFAVSNNVVILALRAMIAEFVFFMGMAAICFSGLLFTLWTLASGSDSGWTLKGIAWLMVQIWFGNTYLSFGQASSFHPLFGPILMTGFAALSNTLLLTILISILSNTFARIDANANREYLFQFAIATIEGVKSDALFSYQPPFNILAFIILKPSSFVLTPRALHSLNVFLVKLTTFPILIVIAIYERYLAAGQRLRESGLDAAHNLFNSLPRQIKTMPIIEALVGSSSNDLYEAIFDLDIPQQEFDDLFDGEDDEDELPALRSMASRDNVRPPRSGPTTPRKRPTSLPRSSLRDRSSPLGSPRPRVVSALAPINLEATHLADAPTERSPLARLFAPKIHTDGSTAAHVEATLKKMETVVEDMRGLPVQKLKDEMKELQDRQARIENLLLMLTRGMRNELGHRDTL
ncbi:Transient receptor potential calcium channel [Pleurotus pulmonarius]